MAALAILLIVVGVLASGIGGAYKDLRRLLLVLGIILIVFGIIIMPWV